MILSTISAVKMQVNTLTDEKNIQNVHKNHNHTCEHFVQQASKQINYYHSCSSLTILPSDSILLKPVDMGWCSMAMNRVFSTMQMVMVKSVNGSITMSSTTFLIFSHSGQQSQIRNVWAKVYQHGGHFFLDSSSSGEKQINPNVCSHSCSSVLVPCRGVRYLPSTVLVMTLAMLRTRCLASGPSRKTLNSCCAPPPLGCLPSVSVVSA